MKEKIVLISRIIIVICGIFAIIYLSGRKLNNKVEEPKPENYDSRIHEILSDDKEIERKWLIDKEKIPYDLTKEGVNVYDIKQTYFSFDPEMRVRDYNNGQAYEMTIKMNMTKDGMVRDEANFDIDKDQYDNLMEKKEGKTIHKTRYQFYDNGQIIAIDIFHDYLDGLAYMEIEFPTEEESNNFEQPDWVTKEVTDDVNYKNGHLAKFGIPKEN